MTYTILMILGAKIFGHNYHQKRVFRFTSSKSKILPLNKTTIKKHNIGNNPQSTKAANSSSLIKRAPATFNIVLDRYCEPIGFKTGPSINEVITFHDALIKNHSVVEGTARYNMIRLYCIMLLEGRNPEPLERVAVGRKDR